MVDERFQAFQQKFRVDELKVFSTQAWTWSVRPAQPTIGAGVLSLNRYAEWFHEVTADEMADLSVAIGRTEKMLKQALDYDKINYLMLMMVDPHVHFHVIPRYATARDFAGHHFGDAGWPAVPSLAAPAADDSLLAALRDQLRALA